MQLGTLTSASPTDGQFRFGRDREALLAAGATQVAATLIETRDQIAQALHPHVKLQTEPVVS